MPATARFTASDSDNTRLANLCGPLERNLRQIETGLEVRIQRRGAVFSVEGPGPAAAAAVSVLGRLHDQASRPIEGMDVHLALVQARAGGPVSAQHDAASDANATVAAGAAGPGMPGGTPGPGGPDEPPDPLAHPAARQASRPAPQPPAPSAAGPVADEMPEAGTGAVPPGHADVPADPVVLHTRRGPLSGRTPNQDAYLRNILDHDITFGIGPAGTGKTYLAVACAAAALERDEVQRIVLTRPAVEAGERLGFLPGDLAQKVDPYLRPLYDALYDIMGFDRVAKLFEKQTIEIAPLAYMRGRTLNHSYIILDEAQNTTGEQMKMFLTRIGFGSRAVITGDVTQVDLPRNQGSGLVQAARVLAGVRGIAFTHFTSADVVRHPLVARIVDAYARETARIEAAERAERSDRGDRGDRGDRNERSDRNERVDRADRPTG